MLHQQVEWYKAREDQYIQRVGFYENMMLKALREQSAAHKGIRRLVEKVKRLKAEAKKEPHDTAS